MRKAVKAKLVDCFLIDETNVADIAYIAIIDMRYLWRLAAPTGSDRYCILSCKNSRMKQWYVAIDSEDRDVLVISAYASHKVEKDVVLYKRNKLIKCKSFCSADIWHQYW